jgi:hypothetical protein
MSVHGFKNNLAQFCELSTNSRQSGTNVALLIKVTEQINDANKLVENKLRVDPNSIYQLKAKYIMQDPILEESLE